MADPDREDERRDHSARTDGDPPAMTRFPVPDLGELPLDLRERIREEEDDAGFIPNVFLAYAYAPEQFRAFFGYYDAVVENAEISRPEIEMVIVAVSGANDCYYCNVAHGALLRLYGDDPLLADQLVANHRNADLSERHRAMLDFAVTLTEDQSRIDDAAVAALEDAGFSRREIWDIGAVTALFNLSNRMAQLADMRPNPEFHTMGR
jgi:alkylhydroperoxidase AhpD family core domain